MSKQEEQLDMIEDQETAAIPTEQAAFIKELEAEEAAADHDPETEKAEQEAEKEQAAMDDQTAQMTAVMGLGTIEFALKRFIHHEFEFTQDTKAYAVENLSPVLIKYGALLPEWLGAYDAEIKAAMAVGKLVSEGMDTAKTLKAQDAAKEANQANQANQANDDKAEKERVRVAA